jgi:hypothetical protein
MDKTQASSHLATPMAEAAAAQCMRYPAGALVRAGDICGDRKKGRAGLLPIARATWYNWIASGRVPAGTKIGQNTTVWPIEIVLGMGSPSDGETSSPDRHPPHVGEHVAA